MDYFSCGKRAEWWALGVIGKFLPASIQLFTFRLAHANPPKKLGRAARSRFPILFTYFVSLERRRRRGEGALPPRARLSTHWSKSLRRNRTSRPTFMKRIPCRLVQVQTRKVFSVQPRTAAACAQLSKLFSVCTGRPPFTTKAA